MDITLQLNDSEARALLQRLRERVSNMKPVMERVGLFYVRSVRENFKAEQSPDGKPWERLVGHHHDDEAGTEGQVRCSPHPRG